MELPVTKYHPDPIATESVVADPDKPCLCCNQKRGYVYTGPAYSEIFHYLSGCICPWCVADGSAARQFRATWTDTGEIDGIPDAVRRELETRTPGFTAWQQDHWLTCCGDAAAYLGRAGVEEMKGPFAKALPALKKHLKDDYDLTGADRDEFIDSLKKDNEPTAYVFRCLHCAKYLAYADEA